MLNFYIIIQDINFWFYFCLEIFLKHKIVS